jgi:hypothetical protein
MFVERERMTAVARGQRPLSGAIFDRLEPALRGGILGESGPPLNGVCARTLRRTLDVDLLAGCLAHPSHAAVTAGLSAPSLAEAAVVWGYARKPNAA